MVVSRLNTFITITLRKSYEKTYGYCIFNRTIPFNLLLNRNESKRWIIIETFLQRKRTCMKLLNAQRNFCARIRFETNYSFHREFPRLSRLFSARSLSAFATRKLRYSTREKSFSLSLSPYSRDTSVPSNISRFKHLEFTEFIRASVRRM